MYKIRQISYARNSVSVQVYKIENRRRVIVKHIGTARTDSQRDELLKLAQGFIRNLTRQVRLFETGDGPDTLHLGQTEFIGVHYRFLYEQLLGSFARIKLKGSVHPLLRDLAIIRIVEPASKVRSVRLIGLLWHRAQAPGLL